ncbi:MAG: DUF4254 domain-containing protein [Verrucomicrobiota bacterium JB022]|nr:DUF4254 domain-containing protein [Verrucomicrobiota bacterium JB022]
MQAKVVDALVELQRERTVRWHEEKPQASLQEGLLALVEQNHLRNFLLWHEEDVARRDDLGAEAVYKAKRAIDGYNQQRNDFMEKIDQHFVDVLQPVTEGVPFNSETPGMMCDRLSILALKEFHMEEQTQRSDASPEHIEKCTHRLAVIRRQQADLGQALRELVREVREKQRSFRVYYQFKMYNDPSLNPELYRKAPQS